MRVHDSLVEGGTRYYGRLASRPADVNPLDEFTGLRRRLRRWRLKEWVGFTLTHPDWYCSLIVQDAQYLASSEMYAYDRRRRTLYGHDATARGGSLGLPAGLLGSGPVFARPGYEIRYDFAAADAPEARHRLRFDIAGTPGGPPVRGELLLDAGRATAPLSVSARLTRRSAMYTHKTIFPAGGVLRIGDDEVRFDPSRDAAILDEHKSFLPYRTRWLWGTFAMATPDGFLGANVAERPTVAGDEEESCLWIPGSAGTPAACEPLADIRFSGLDGAGSGADGSVTARRRDPLAPWRVTSRDGRLDLTFEPEGRKLVRHQFGVVAMDYFQLYGRYRGTLRSLSGRAYEVADAHGVCESMRARL